MRSRRWLAMALGTWLGGALVGSSGARADWLTLQDGTVLRGIDLVEDGKGRGYRFTLETGKTVRIPEDRIYHLERGPRSERVEFRGRSVSLRRKVRALQKERAARGEELVEELVAATRSKEAQKTAIAKVRAIEPVERSEHLIRALRRERRPAVRWLAARELARLDALEGEARRDVIGALVRSSLGDASRGVRVQSLAGLREFEADEVAPRIFPELRSRDVERRLRAVGALAVVPHPKAAEEIVATLDLAWAGFGRGYFLSGEQRAYVADYDLVSGGTGFSVAEVADPVVRTVSSGVSLEVDIQRVEMRVRRKVLTKLLGADPGPDPRRWKAWVDARLADRKRDGPPGGAGPGGDR